MCADLILATYRASDSTFGEIRSTTRANLGDSRRYRVAGRAGLRSRLRFCSWRLTERARQRGAAGSTNLGHSWHDSLTLWAQPDGCGIGWGLSRLCADNCRARRLVGETGAAFCAKLTRKLHERLAAVTVSSRAGMTLVGELASTLCAEARARYKHVAAVQTKAFRSTHCPDSIAHAWWRLARLGDVPSLHHRPISPLARIPRR